MYSESGWFYNTVNGLVALMCKIPFYWYVPWLLAKLKVSKLGICTTHGYRRGPVSNLIMTYAQVKKKNTIFCKKMSEQSLLTLCIAEILNI